MRKTTDTLNTESTLDILGTTLPMLFFVCYFLITKSFVPLEGEQLDYFYFLSTAVLSIGLAAILCRFFPLVKKLNCTIHFFLILALIQGQSVSALSLCCLLCGGQILIRNLYVKKSTDLTAAVTSENYKTFFDVLIFWLVFSRLFWFEKFELLFSDSTRLGDVILFIVIPIFSSLVLYSELFSKKSGLNRTASGAIEYVFVGSIAAYFSFWPATFNFHHWSFYAGPADLVQKGGYLLFDVPSQYGFLNILLLSVIRADTLESVYTSISIINAASFLIVYYLVTRRFQSCWHRLLISPVAVIIVFFVPGLIANLAGPNSFPSVGGLRFFWPLFLFCIVSVLNSVAKYSKHIDRFYFAGNIAWLIGCLWSFESLIYSSLTWLPAYYLHYLGQNSKTKSGINNLAFAVPLILLTLSIFAIAAFYKARLGEFPDFYGYVEYALAYTGGFGALPISWTGAVWIPILCLSVVVWCAAIAIQRKELNKFCIHLSGYGLIVSTSTYFLSRSHDNNVCNIFPLLLVVCLTCFSEVASSEEEKIANLSCKLTGVKINFQDFYVPVFSLVLLIFFTNVNFEKNFLSKLRNPFSVQAVFNSFKIEPNEKDKKILALLKIANPSSSLPVVNLVSSDVTGSNLNLNYPYWLPIAPVEQFLIPTPERQKIYISRFVARQSAEQIGLVVYDKNDESSSKIIALLKDIGIESTMSISDGAYSIDKFERFQK